MGKLPSEWGLPRFSGRPFALVSSRCCAGDLFSTRRATTGQDPYPCRPHILPAAKLALGLPGHADHDGHRAPRPRREIDLQFSLHHRVDCSGKSNGTTPRFKPRATSKEHVAAQSERKGGCESTATLETDGAKTADVGLGGDPSAVRGPGGGGLWSRARSASRCDQIRVLPSAWHPALPPRRCLLWGRRGPLPEEEHTRAADELGRLGSHQREAPNLDRGDGGGRQRRPLDPPRSHPSTDPGSPIRTKPPLPPSAPPQARRPCGRRRHYCSSPPAE